jgi:hypothetical protein
MTGSSRIRCQQPNPTHDPTAVPNSHAERSLDARCAVGFILQPAAASGADGVAASFYVRREQLANMEASPPPPHTGAAAAVPNAGSPSPTLSGGLFGAMMGGAMMGGVVARARHQLASKLAQLTAPCRRN